MKSQQQEWTPEQLEDLCKAIGYRLAAKTINAALADERQCREQEAKLRQKYHLEIQNLKGRLLSAQAAIEKLKGFRGVPDEFLDILDSIDLSALPLVKALEQAYVECEATHFRVAQQTISSALARVKEQK